MMDASLRLIRPTIIRSIRCVPVGWRRNASAATASARASNDDLEVSSFSIPSLSQEAIEKFDPVAVAEESRKQIPNRGFRNTRKRQLPPSRYKFRSPRYYRGELHPHQPLPPDDLASREFVPGPFSRSRLSETYDAVLASDVLTLCYTHVVPGEEKGNRGVDRLRPWVGDSPYYENRPHRGPRGGREMLRPLYRPITDKNIPQLKKIVIHAHTPDAAENSAYLHTASIALQSISGVRAATHKAKKSVMEWGAREGKYVSLTVNLEGEAMYDFLAKLIQIVLPRVKDFRGIKPTTGDSTGNVSFGLRPEELALFPEIEVNYDMYPAHMIPGCHVMIQTTAVTDHEARLLMSALGIPFKGQLKKQS